MKKNLVWFAVMLVSLLMVLSAASAATMTMPDGLKIIDVEAFYGDNSISTVVLPSGITEIRARAFANSSLREMNLPDSLTFIAEDALPSPTQLQVTATRGTYAYEWAGAHGFLVPAPVQNDLTGQNEKITVSWKAASGGADSYTVYYGTSSSFSAATAIPGITGTSHTITALEPGTVYYTWVKTVRGGEESLPSDRKSAITYPSAPVLRDPIATTNSITLSWDAVKGASIYRLHYNTQDDYSTAVKIDNITKTSYTIENLEHSTDYYFWSTSANASGGLRTTNPLKVTTAVDVSAPLQQDPTPSIRKITVSWEKFEGATSYKVYYSENTDILVAKEVANITDTNYSIGNLDTGTTYYTWVKAVTAAGDSKASNMKKTQTYPTAPALKYPIIGNNCITLNWDEVKGAAFYQISYNTENALESATSINSITETSCKIENLEPNQEYYIWSASFNSDRKGARTITPLIFTTAVPIQRELKPSIRKMTVTWVQFENATSYKIYYGTSNDISKAKVKDGIIETSCEIGELEPGTTYYTWVKAVTSSGDSNASNVKQGMTYPAAPELKEPVISGNSVKLSWEPVLSVSKYYLKYGKSNNNSTATTTEDIQGTTYTIKDLEYNTTYYIWPYSVNSSGTVYRTQPLVIKTEAAP